MIMRPPPIATSRRLRARLAIKTLIQGALVASLASGDVRARAACGAHGAARDAPAYAHMIRAADALVAQRWRSAGRDESPSRGTAAEEIARAHARECGRARAKGDVDRYRRDLAPLAQIRPYGGLFAYQQAMALDYAGRRLKRWRRMRSGAGRPCGCRPALSATPIFCAHVARAIRPCVAEARKATAPIPRLSRRSSKRRAGAAGTMEPLTPARGAASGLYGMRRSFRRSTTPRAVSRR
jgi:hypothetical protein